MAMQLTGRMAHRGYMLLLRLCGAKVRKERTATSMLCSELKRAINGPESVPEDIWRGLQEQKRVVCGRRDRTLQYREISANDHLLPTHIYGH